VKESTSNPEFLKRTGVASLWTGIVAGLAVALRWDWEAASGFMVALLWSVANFAVLSALIKAATHPGGKQMGRFAGFAGMKLLFYAGAAVILLNLWFPVPFFVAGVSWPLLVGVLKGLSPLLVRPGADRTPRENVS